MFRSVIGRFDQPIINSLLDLDFYKLTMGQMVFHQYLDVEVTYGLTNRTKSVRLADHIDIGQLREELDHAMSLRLKLGEIYYLRGMDAYDKPLFREDYLKFLHGVRLPEYRLEVSGDGQFILEFTGPWKTAIYWETIALSIVNELYFRSLMAKLSVFEREAVFAQGILRLKEKIEALKAQGDITFTDFGTRRRFSFDWQYFVNESLAEAMPESQFLGTSNTLMAKRLDLLPMGTSAHEMYMVPAALARDNDKRLLASHSVVLRTWWEEYGWALSVALTDTFGNDFSFRDMNYKQASEWKGLRHDSGDPFEFGRNAIQFYQGLEIDPSDKLIVFSDGLDLSLILKLAAEFRGKFRPTFGWGTNLTNDLGFKALSLVVKVTSANGHPTVKLSDNMAKAMGPSDQVERYKRIFGHTVDAFVECKS